MNFNWGLQFLDGDLERSMLRDIGTVLAWLFVPLGFGTWQGAVASVSAEIAKEQAVATLGMLAHAASDAEADMATAIRGMFGTPLVGLSFLLFNIFDAPCLVAIATAFREQGSRKWGWITFLFQMGVGYCLALCVYQLGMLFTQGVFGFWTLVAIVICLAVCYFVFRKTPDYGRLSDEPHGANA